MINEICYNTENVIVAVISAIGNGRVRPASTAGMKLLGQIEKESVINDELFSNRRDWIRTSGLRSAAVGAKPTSPGRRAPSTPELRSVRFDRWLAYILIN